MADRLFISWEEYHGAIEALAVEIVRSGWEFDSIICLARGGLRVGDVFSRLWEVPLGILATRSYRGEGNRGSLTIAPQLTFTGTTFGKRVLLVDDLVDSGVTLRDTLDFLRAKYPDIEEWQTAVIWYKAVSVFQPDYYVYYLPDNPWIYQPFEKYESLSPRDLLEK
jgi:uncharacterized protein